MLDIHELSKELKISTGGIYHWVSQRKIPYLKIGRNIRFDPEAIKQWLESKEVNPKNLNSRDL